MRISDGTTPATQPQNGCGRMTWQGRSGSYGRPATEIIGEGRDSEASEAIISLVDRPDPRPVWFCVWGGSCDLVQAIWKVRETRSPADTERFIEKIRVYLIALQDGSGQWLLDTFSDLFVIVSERNYQGMFYTSGGSDASLSDHAWLNEHVRRGHGILGSIPRKRLGSEAPRRDRGRFPFLSPSRRRRAD